jgi:putative ABC transport system ATP-binding protein
MIEIRDLKKVYRVGEVDVQALRGVNLSVARGEFLCVVGPSGSGKSTLFHILGGLTPPTSGAIHIDGRDLLKMTDAERTDLRKRTVGFVFQKYNLLPTLTAEENIEIARDIAGRPEKDPQFDLVLKLLGIDGRMHHKPRALSGGEQQRVAIARAVVGDPRLIVADEPTGNLDIHNGEEVMDMLAILNEQGATILMATHSPAHANRARRVLYMLDGRLVSDAARAVA